MSPTALISRRSTLGLLGSGLAAATLPRVSFAAGNARHPLVIILLRGGLDGQALLPLHGDPDYGPQRGALALGTVDQDHGIIDLNGKLGLHPAAQALLPFWAAGQMAVAPAVASPYRGTLHSEAQRMLEGGYASMDATGADPSGWLNRAIAASGTAASSGKPLGFSTASNLPLLLRGDAPVSPWLPESLPVAAPGFLSKAATLYAHDPFLAQALTAGMQAKEQMRLAFDQDHRDALAGRAQAQDLIFIAARVGQAISADDGPKVAVIEIGGWDTHHHQGATIGPLARRIAGLADGIAALAEALNPVWSESMIVAISEFGRSVIPNAEGGTDPGGAGAALLVGGALAKSSVLGTVPKLASDALVNGTQLATTLDSRALFKAVLMKQFGLSRSALEKRVFPNSNAVAPVSL